MAEKIFKQQVNFGWGFSFNMTGKAPAVAKRIFDKYEDALAYANDVNDSAIEGLVLSVVADDDTLNGLYFVKQVASPAIEADEEKGIEAVEAKSAILIKLSTNADSQITADEVSEALAAYSATTNATLENINEQLSANTQAHTTLDNKITTGLTQANSAIAAIKSAYVNAAEGEGNVKTELIENADGNGKKLKVTLEWQTFE